MEERTLDARAMPCPLPVVESRKALLAGATTRLRVLLADRDAAENVVRMARTLGFGATIEPSAGNPCAVLVEKRSDHARRPVARKEPAPEKRASPAAGLVILVTASGIGQGPEELGRILMRSFLKTIPEAPIRPSALLFLHGGIHLTTEGSDVLADLARLAETGIELLSCGTCLDYFHKKDKLRAGRVTDMLEIVSRLAAADKVVHL